MGVGLLAWPRVTPAQAAPCDIGDVGDLTGFQGIGEDEQGELWIVHSDGEVWQWSQPLTGPSFILSAGLAAPISDATSLGSGVVAVGTDGGVFAFGGAGYYGSLPGAGIVPTAPIVAIESTVSGEGYWLFGADGGVFSFGDASFHGSLPSIGVCPEASVIDAEVTSTGNGYLLAAGDGGVFAFGDARFQGSAAGPGSGSHDFSLLATSPAGYLLVDDLLPDEQDGVINTVAFGDATVCNDNTSGLLSRSYFPPTDVLPNDEWPPRIMLGNGLIFDC